MISDLLKNPQFSNTVWKGSMSSLCDVTEPVKDIKHAAGDSWSTKDV